MLHLREFIRGQCPDVDGALIDRHFRCMPPGYAERHSAAEIVRHLLLLSRLSSEERVTVEVRTLAPHTLETLLVGEDYTGTVACITAAIAALRFNLEDVLIHSYLQTAEEQEVDGPPYFVIVLRISGNLKGQTAADFARELRERLQSAFAHLAQGDFHEAQTIAADTRVGAESHATPHPNHSMPTRRQPQQYEGLIVGDFRLDRKLASGGAGTVYLATQRNLNRTVAVKLYNHTDKADDDVLLRFHQEVRVLAQFNCPYIVQVLAADTIEEDNGNGTLGWMAMEYMGGGDLAHWQQQYGSPSPALATRWFREALEGLQYAHRHGILHRDLKPHNMLLTGDDGLKISDFGLLKQAQRPVADLTPHAIVLGTPHYMSPEQALGEQVDERSDIFSLGTTFYQLLTGKLPFQRDSITALLVAIAQQDAPQLLDVAPNAPLPLAVIIGRMMARRREERYQDVAVILEDLAGYERRSLLETRACDLPSPVPGPHLLTGDKTRSYRLQRNNQDDAL